VIYSPIDGNPTISGETMAFPANVLEQTLAGARAGQATTDQLTSALAENPLWVPLPRGLTGDGQGNLRILLIDEQPYVAVYTSDEQFARGAGELPHTVLSGRELAALMAPELGLAINPGGELGLPLRPEGVRRLRGGAVPAGTQIRIGAPAEEPVDLLAALRAAFAAAPAVLEARCALAQVGHEAPTLLIGMRPDQRITGWQESAVAVVRGVAAQVRAPHPVDATFLTDDTDPVTAAMLHRTEPFYRRDEA
jgi:hypothetical protein